MLSLFFAATAGAYGPPRHHGSCLHNLQEEEKLLGSQPDPDRYYREVILPHKLSMNLDYLDRVSLSYDVLLVFRTTCTLLVPLWTPKRQ